MPDEKKKKGYEVYIDGQGREVVRATGMDEDIIAKEKLQDASGLGAAAKKAKEAGPVKEEVDVEKMSPFQRAAYLAKKKREGASTATPLPRPTEEDEETKKRKKKLTAGQQVSALLRD